MNIGYRSDTAINVVWTELVQSRGARKIKSYDWPSEVSVEDTVKLFEDLPEPIHMVSGDAWGAHIITEYKGTLIRLYVNTSGRQMTAVIANDNQVKIDQTNAFLIEMFPRYEPKSDQINVTFWTLGPDGPETHVRALDAPDWVDIRSNYSTDTRTQIESLLDHSLSIDEGKLILWHGVPGTGKTFAIRSLAKEWKDKIDVHYILDPEQFFDAKAAYMIRVLLSQSSKWKLILLEDSGEFLAKDAKAHQGQGLSRLLNVCDGMIGQGLKLLVMITTNEDLGLFHEAVTRPGRCLAKTEFKPLDTEAVLNWSFLNNRIYEGDVPATLANLYVGSQQIKATTPARRVGFQHVGTL